MVPQGKGCILFTASACVSIAGFATLAYAATKHAVAGLAKNLTAKLGAHGILRVTVRGCDGYAWWFGSDGKTMFAGENVHGRGGELKGKILTAEDVAQAALYLASDESGYVSGLNLVVDGGLISVNPSMMALMVGLAMRGKASTSQA